ncbi:MAG: hypothetical protein J6K92_05350 [Oscillospiraceae bacterium]|nr:hypothetical protein [Oscillospiraceae bacterium]
MKTMHLKLKKSLAFLLCFSMLLTTGAASVFCEDAPEEESAAAEEAAAEEEEEEEAPRTEAEAFELMEQVDSNDRLALYMNTKENTIMLEDKYTGEKWWSNPVDLQTSNAKKGQKDELASGMTLIYGSPADRATTILNSKGKGKTKMKKSGKNIEITYTFSEPGITVPVTISLESDYMKLYVDTSAITEDNSSSVSGKLTTDLAFMTTFGAAGMDEEGYFVVPDGSGAIINFNNGKTGLKTYTGKVYGRDITAVKTQKQATTQKVSLPMYGIVKGNSAMMVVADKGDTCASVNTYVANQNNTDYNSTYFDFELRTQDEYLMGGESSPLKVFEKRGILIPEIELRYYPVSNKDQSEVDYTDVADRFRDYLVNDKGVEDKNLEGNNSLYLDIYGATLKKKSIAGLPVTVKEPVTTFADAKKILETLNGMGVDDMVVAYNNYNNDNIGEKIADSYNPSSKLGGKKEFNKLTEYASANNIQIFPVIDNQQFKTGNGYWSMTNTSIRVSNAYSKIPVFDLAHGIENKYYKPLSLFSPASYDKAFGKLIKSYNKKNVTNFSFGSLANTIYGDYGKKAVSRENAKETVKEIYSSAKQTGSVLSDNPAAYVLPYTDCITNVPLCSSKFDLFDMDIPLYQMVLHGVTPYSCTAVNGEADLDIASLMAIASGSNIGFDLVGTEASELKDTKLDKYFYGYYENWINEAAGLYKLADEVLSPAADSPIASYTVSEDGNEITTVYDNGYTTVVNLEKRTVKADGKTLKLTDYIGEEVIGE